MSSASLPMDAAGKRPVFFDDPALDQILSMVLELAAEQWVTRERLYRLEIAAARNGLDLPSLVETLGLTEEEEAELTRRRDAHTRSLFRTLNRQTGSDAVA